MGKYHLAPYKKYPFVIVMVSPLGETFKFLKHYIYFLNQQGFDVYTYSAFLYGKPKWNCFLPLISKNSLGVIKIWTQELEQHLNSIEGMKVIFSFSFPSIAALLATSYRTDIKGVICDGGPFKNIFSSCWRFLTYHQPISFIFFKIYITIKMYYAFKISPAQKKQLLTLPKNLMVLSLQSVKDKQIPPHSIKIFFKTIKHIKLTVCLLYNSSHLEGLKKEKSFYTKNVLSFLKKIPIK